MEDVDVPFGIDGHAGRLDQVLRRRQLEEIRDSLVIQFWYWLRDLTGGLIQGTEPKNRGDEVQNAASHKDPPACAPYYYHIESGSEAEPGPNRETPKLAPRRFPVGTGSRPQPIISQSRRMEDTCGAMAPPRVARHR